MTSKTKKKLREILNKLWERGYDTASIRDFKMDVKLNWARNDINQALAAIIKLWEKEGR